MTTTDMIQFWSNCVKHREHQLEMLIKSYEDLLVPYSKRDERLIEYQRRWVSEQESKLYHAQAMLNFYRGLA